jgi:hypothetical protein
MGDDPGISELFAYALHDTGVQSNNLNFFRDVFAETGGYPLDRYELYPTIGQTSTRYADSLYSPSLCFSLETGWVYRTDGVLWDIPKYKYNGEVLIQTISNFINSLPRPGDIIIDNRDSASVVYQGEWISSVNVAGYYGQDYVHDNNVLKGLKSVEFNPAISDGFYEVFLRWTSADGRGTNVPVKIYHADGITDIIINQEKKGAGWNSLGIYKFNAAGLSKIKIETAGTDGYVIADAVRLSRRAGPVDAAENELLPTQSFLYQNYPNPFNSETIIRYELPEGGNLTSLKIFDILGAEVKTLINREQPAGYFEIKVSMSELPGGVYFYRLSNGRYSGVRKMIYLK